ncbi:hypothetical protein [Parabacteroides timonensis]|uniref:hypothetical protein n=1 Tax=Parabacteroides timonensis TaxID=1871013 RepID=UPI00094E1425|nr:hypothetical protein [Parabacteroides timonensis]
MRSIHYYIKLSAVWAGLGLTVISGLAQEVVERNISSLHWGYDVGIKRSADGKKLCLSLHVDAVTRLGAQEALVIYPSIVSVSGDKRIDFTPVSIAGRIRYKAIMRSKALGENFRTSHFDNKLYPFSDMQEQGISFQESVPFERWMADGHVVVREELLGCFDCGIRENQGTVAVIDQHVFKEEDYVYDFLEPEKMVVKYYKDSFDCKVTFPVASYELRKAFANNGQELARLEGFISRNLGIKGVELKEVLIEGFASPEGQSEYNRSLAEGRTLALSNYISRKYSGLKKAAIYRTVGVGEDWEGLKKLVSISSLSNKEEVLSIISRYPTDTERESAIRNLDNGKTYDSLLNEFYPQLRRTTFRFCFDVRAYTQEELPGIFAVKPECLSSHEMYQLSEIYLIQGESPLPVFRKAYEQFPGDVVAILNYANALLKYEKKADSALRVLSGVRNDSRALYPMAVAYHIKGDWKKAEKLLKEAYKQGDDRARAFYGEDAYE